MRGQLGQRRGFVGSPGQLAGRARDLGASAERWQPGLARALMLQNRHQALVDSAAPDHFVSDCPMAAEQIARGTDKVDANHPMSLLRSAYGI